MWRGVSIEGADELLLFFLAEGARRAAGRDWQGTPAR